MKICHAKVTVETSKCVLVSVHEDAHASPGSLTKAYLVRRISRITSDPPPVVKRSTPLARLDLSHYQIRAHITFPALA